jgi:hypothetical protein
MPLIKDRLSNMKMLLLLLLSFNFVGGTAFARLGETADQLEKRFGPAAPYKPAAQVVSQGHVYPYGQILNFSSGDWSVSCTMINGICEQITYQKRGDFTEEQISTILNNEAQGSKWTESTSYKTVVDSLFMPTFHVREWRRADGAFATRTGSMMTLNTPDYDKAVEAAKAQGTAEAQKMPGNL